MAKKLSNLKIEDAQVVFRNFAGKRGTYNNEGRRNFCVILDDKDAAKLKLDGWNVKYLKPREEGDKERPYLQVAVSYDNYPPNIFLVTHRGKNRLTEETVSQLDWADIVRVDLIISPYEWEFNGKSGVKAYAKTMYVTVEEDEFEERYTNCPDSAQSTVGGCGNCDGCDGSCGHHEI